MNYEYLINEINNKEIIDIIDLSGSRYCIFIDPMRDDEEFMIEVRFNKDFGGNSIPYLWHKFGYTDKVLDNYIIINTYRTNKDGFCVNHYNPQINEKHKINFDYILETNEENLKILIDKVIEMYKKDIRFLNDEEKI